MIMMMIMIIIIIIIIIRGGADKSVARPGRKETTAKILGIYSTYSTRSSINFLGCCSNFCKQLKKIFRTICVQRDLRGSNYLRVGRKIANFQLLFSPANKWYSDGAGFGE